MVSAVRRGASVSGGSAASSEGLACSGVEAVELLSRGSGWWVVFDWRFHFISKVMSMEDWVVNDFCVERRWMEMKLGDGKWEKGTIRGYWVDMWNCGWRVACMVLLCLLIQILFIFGCAAREWDTARGFFFLMLILLFLRLLFAVSLPFFEPRWAYSNKVMASFSGMGFLFSKICYRLQ